MNVDKEEKSKYKYRSSKNFKTVLNRNDLKYLTSNSLTQLEKKRTMNAHCLTANAQIFTFLA